MTIDKIKKIQALVNRATGGEKEAAEAMLHKLVEKYDIDLSSVDDTEEEVDYYDWHYTSPQEEVLLLQIIWRTIGSDESVYRTLHRRQREGCYCTKSQAVEISLEYEFHCREFSKELDDFVVAYVFANDLTTDGSTSSSLTEERKRQIRKASWLASGLEKHTRQLAIEEETTCEIND